MIPPDLLDPQYSDTQPIVPIPTTPESYEAYAGQSIADMPTMRALNAVSRLNTSEETPVSADFLNKAMPPINGEDFKTQMPYSDAQDIYQERQATAARQSIIERSDMSGWGDLAFKAGTSAITMLGDPITDAAFVATDGLAAGASAPIAKAIGYVTGEGIIGKTLLSSAKLGIHGTFAGVPITGLNAALAKSEDKPFTMKDAAEQELEFGAGGLALGFAGGFGLGVVQKAGMFSKVGEELFSKLRPDEKEAIISNTASQLQGKGSSDFTVAGLTDAVTTSEAKLGIPAKTGGDQAAFVNHQTPDHPAEIFNHQIEFDLGENNPPATEGPAGADKEGFANKAYGVKDLNSHETKQLYFSTGDEDFLTISEQKWRGESKALAEHFVGQHPEDIVTEAQGNPIAERFVRENYPDLTDAFIDKTSAEGAEGDQAIINQNRRDIISRLEQSDNPLTKKLFYSDDGEQLNLNMSDKEMGDLAQATRKSPEELYNDLIEQRKSQVQQLKEDRLNSAKEAIKNGTFDKTLEPDSIIPKDFTAEPSVEPEDLVDEQTRQVDELQKNLDDNNAERMKDQTPEERAMSEEESKAEREVQDEEVKRNTAKRGFLRQATDCFFGVY